MYYKGKTIIFQVPISIYIVVCLYAKPDRQIQLAQLLSVLYALLMMAVLVGMVIQVSKKKYFSTLLARFSTGEFLVTITQITEDGWLAPTSLSFLFVAGTFVLAGCLHPQEFWYSHSRAFPAKKRVLLKKKNKT